MLPDVPEAGAVRLPHGPAATIFLVQELGDLLLLPSVQPALGHTRARVTLPPPGAALAREQELAAVVDDRAVAAVVVEQQLVARAPLALHHIEAFTVPPEVVARRLDEQVAVGRVFQEGVAGC